jgi:hypothetical protein
MNDLTDAEFKQYNQLGLIPGPSETYEAFVKRIHYCLDLRENLTVQPSQAPFLGLIPAPPQLLEEAFHITENLYDIRLDWIPLFFSNYKLAFWHGGCAWIFQETENTPTGAFMQLRKAFHTSATYLGLYKRDRLIAHELSHVGRMMFEEPKFEEVLAYQSDSSAFRRYFGPIVQSSWESTLFVVLLFLFIVMDFLLLEFPDLQDYRSLVWLKFTPLAMIFYAIGRLVRKQRQFSTCLSQLQKVIEKGTKAKAIAYRLTDDEICRFANRTPKDILEYVNVHKDQSLRWKVLFISYFSCNSYTMEEHIQC